MIYLDTLIYNLHGPLKEYTSCTRPIYIGDFPSSVTMCADSYNFIILILIIVLDGLNNVSVCIGTDNCGYIQATNNRLRTGTDKGNLTV